MCSGSDSELFTAQSTCSAGSCQKPAAKTCGGSLVCSGSACKTSCSSDNDCVGGLVCSGGACGVSFAVDSALSGRVQSDGVIDPRVSIGDYADNVDSCGFLSFPFDPPIPSGATVTDAKLNVTLQSLTGTPYADLGGSLVVDDTSYDALSLSIYKASFVSPTGIPKSDTAGAKTVTVTSLVAKDVSKGRSQFRLCFPTRTDGNNDQDFVLIPTGGTSKATLFVTYTR